MLSQRIEGLLQLLVCARGDVGDADIGDDAWSVLNRIQENVIRGGLRGVMTDANGRMQRRQTREVKGIDQNNMLNRALWKLATEVAKIAA